MTPTNEQIRAAIAEQSHHWFVENRAAPLEGDAAARFMDWLRTSPQHVEEYLMTVALANELKYAACTAQIDLEPLLDRAMQETDNVIALDQPQVRSPQAPRYRGRRRLAAAAAVVLVAVTALWIARDGERAGLPRSYRTAHGEQSVRVLPDGSVLHLNTDSQVTLRFSRHERLVTLDKGQAFLEVMHEEARGFRVRAGETQILDVGTRFDVYRRSGSVVVTVVEGVAAVYRGEQPLALHEALPSGAVRVEAGYQVEVLGKVGTARAVDTRSGTAWLRKQIAFENEPLGAVADEFNRYGGAHIEIEDANLRSLPITGVFDAYDTDSFLAFLATLKDVIVQKTATRVRVIMRTATPRGPSPQAR
jgi:transmembrane sensor